MLELPRIIKTMSEDDGVIKVLDGISLDIRKGECFGIIGQNGTGKSTLLRLIAGIIPPDSGTITVHGSLIPLLSLSVGFSGELDARDNVYQYGMILGFSKKEMDAMYDDIIAFADLEKYQSMHLKNFSTGMRVKLGFSTAVRIDPDILVLDEVLSVGDVTFKEKSKKKILEFCNSDRTVVIVSHSMSTISELCDRAMFLKDGKIGCIGNPADVISAYMEAVDQSPEPREIVFAHRITREKEEREVQKTRVHRILNQVSEAGILPLVRTQYDADTERSLNEYLTWENLKKITDLQEAMQHEKGTVPKDPFLGSSVLSFLTRLGDESASLATGSRIIRFLIRDGIIIFGNQNLAALFEQGIRPPEIPGRLVTLLIRDGSRTIPVVLENREIRRINHAAAVRILEKAHCNPVNGATLILAPDVFDPEGIAVLIDNAIRFIAPLPVREMEKPDFDACFFDGIVSPDRMMIVNDKPVFSAEGRFELERRAVDGYGYFDPALISMEYRGFFERLSALNAVFGAINRTPSVISDALIPEVAKKDSHYFSRRVTGDREEISFRPAAVLKRKRLAGMTFLYHSGFWGAEECYRNYLRRQLTEQAFLFYRQIIVSDDPLIRGRAVASLINVSIRLGAI